ncbi:MAG TPA: BTAD domain-containing putative transcriptional regulator [Burkholderiales bacterium]|nr:BTAD domain-containing putative transcriptional regulator [Burkholderiales bacterium]
MARKAPQLAKLSRPRLYDALPRERLFRLIDEKRRHPAIWVCGPPGAGKTTLIASYLEAVRLSSIWYQVDAGDADPATFFYYLALAAGQRRTARQLPLFTAEYLPDLEGFSRRYFRDFFARVPSDTLLVFDNCHEVRDNGEFDRILLEAIDEVPEGINVVFISRSGPPAAFARGLSNRSVSVVDWPDLKLTLEEAAAIAETRIVLDQQSIERIYDRSSGWVAGLTLILDHAKRRGLSVDTMETETKEGVFAFFASQIFDQMSRRAQLTMMRVAVLPFTTVPMAIALSGDPRAGALVEDLYRRHLFTDRRGRDDARYQFHSLFREFLLEKFRESHLEPQRRDLSRSAAALLEGAGFTEDAIALYWEAVDWERAIALILKHASMLVAQGRWRTLWQWIEAIPESLRERDARLLYWQGITSMQLDLATASGFLESAFTRFGTGGDVVGQLLAASAIIECIYYQYEDFTSLDRWIDEIDRLLQSDPMFPDERTELTVYSAMQLATMSRRPGHSRLSSCVEKIEALVERARDPNQTVRAASALLRFFSYAGAFERAQRLTERVAPLLSSPELTALNRAWWWLFHGWYLHARADASASLSSFDEADRIAGHEGLRQITFLSSIFRAYLFNCLDDPASAEKAVAIAEQHFDPRRRMHVAQLHLAKMGIAVRQQEGEAAAQHAREGLRAIAPLGSNVLHVIWLFDNAVGLVAAGAHEEAANWLELAWSESEGSYLEVYRPAILLVQAALCKSIGESSRCLECLRNSLELARPNNGAYFYRWLLGLTEIMLAHAIEAGIDIEHVTGLIRKFDLRSPDISFDRWPWPIRIVTLGRFAIYRDGKAITFPHKAPRKPLSLLKAVVAFGCVDVPQRKLADALWPDEEGDVALESLAINVHRLRKLLGDKNMLRLSDRALSLDQERCWVDVKALERALERPIPDASSIGNVDDQVLRLYGGQFLPGDEDEPWVLSLRERLRARLMAYVARVGRQLEARAEYEAAAQHYQRGIESDELAEEFYQGLMRCYLKLGRRADGMAVFRRLRQTLSVTLGIQPSPASQEVFRDLEQA